MKQIYLAGGCFWGVEKYIAIIPGVIKTEAGYANGRTANPSYEDVCRRDTGHAETVKADYDPVRLELSRLLDLFYGAIDPTSVNRQGHNIGTQYRTGVYYTDEGDQPVILASIASLGTKYDKPIAVEVLPLENYYTAEEYHQKYLDKNPGGYCHIGPDIFERLRRALEQ
jgi:methionine-S-sulfoxide reductase